MSPQRLRILAILALALAIVGLVSNITLLIFFYDDFDFMWGLAVVLAFLNVWYVRISLRWYKQAQAEIRS